MLESASHGLFYAVFSFHGVLCYLCRRRRHKDENHRGDRAPWRQDIPNPQEHQMRRGGTVGGWVGGDAGGGGGVPISNSILTPALDPDWPSHSTE